MAHNTYKCTAETKEKLLRAITQLIREKGYPQVTVRDICSRAGVSSGSFYHHYGSKEALVLEAYRHIDKLVTPEVMGQCMKKQPLDALKKLMRLEVDFVADTVGEMLADYYRVLLEGSATSAFSSDRPYYQAVYLQIERCQQQGIIPEDRSTRQLTEFCIHFLRGLLFDWTIHGFRYDVKAYFERDFSILISGLTGKAPGEKTNA